MGYEIREIDVGNGLQMRLRYYPGGNRPPVLMLHGLTRNAADFTDLAPKIAASGRDVAVFNFRGRGVSDYDPEYTNYFPTTYVRDVKTAMDAMGMESAVFIGTSLGGIVTMLTNESDPKRVRAAVLNDVGPELAVEGIMRIAGYVGRNFEPATSIEEAAERIKAINGVAFPDAKEEDWLLFAERTFRKQDDGTWILDYDPNIGRALIEAGPAPDLWPAFESLKDTPTLLIRGAISDLLSAPIVEKMRAVHPGFDYVEVPRTGHAPMLTEPAALSAIENFIERFG